MIAELHLRLQIGPSTDMAHLQQLLAYARLVDPSAMQSMSGAVDSRVTPHPISTPAPTAVITDEDPMGVGTDDGADTDDNQDPGAADGAPRKRRGRKSNAEKAADAAAAQAAASGAGVPPGMGVNPPPPANPIPPAAGAIPPAVAVPPAAPVAAVPPAAPPAAAVPPAAMPPVNGAAPQTADGDVTAEELQACYAAVIAHKGPAVMQLMKAPTWPDGSPKKKWYTIPSVDPTDRSRLLECLMAL